ncbi:MAG: DUF2306 domain-containing protein [Raineya sp.]|jgi:uncharacterized membrane protein|nr:DUF2306 domain-containing protein [Raineya sp.]
MKVIFNALLITLLYVGFIGMSLTIYQYTTFDLNIGFLAYKQPLISNFYWKVAFYIHVFTCFICIGAGFTQFSNDTLKNYPKLHKVAGKIYVYNIMFINFPFALILGVYANGGIASKIAFILLDFLWLYFTLMGVYQIKKGEIHLHKNYMIRSYALTLTAFTLRLCKFIMSKISNWDYDSIYTFDAWMALCLNMLIAEIIIYRNIIFQKNSSY